MKKPDPREFRKMAAAIGRIENPVPPVISKKLARKSKRQKATSKKSA